MAKAICGIYRLTSPSGKLYIGQSRNVKQRFSKYKRLQCKDQPKLYNALVKYGADSFKYEILEECDINVLDEKEKFYIKNLNTISSGYNCRAGGLVPPVAYAGTQNIEFYIDNVLYKSIKQASDALGIPMKTIHNRLNSKNDSFSNYRYKNQTRTPKRRPRHQRNKPFCIDKIMYHNLDQASKCLGIPRLTIYNRLKSKTEKFDHYKYC